MDVVVALAAVVAGNVEAAMGAVVDDVVRVVWAVGVVVGSVAAAAALRGGSDIAGVAGAMVVTGGTEDPSTTLRRLTDTVETPVS